MQRPDEKEHTLSAGSLGGLIRAVLRFGRINPEWWPCGQAFTEDTPQGTRWRQRMRRVSGANPPPVNRSKDVKSREEFTKMVDAALLKASEDAYATGAGFVRILRDGTVERLPPSRVRYMPHGEEQNETKT